jgi:hypothetical protein
MRYTSNNILSRKEALFIISRHFKFANTINKNLRDDLEKIIRKSILSNMIKSNLLERVSRDKIKIINPEKSANVNMELLLKLISVGKG